MCGIFGYWDRRQQALADEALRGMAQALLHRGPDDEGIHHAVARGVAVGNRRLSIIDLGGGHQPFVSHDGQIAVVQNGEIFNHVELAAELRAQGVRLDTHSDTEVILRLYEREGIACLQRLNGMFAIAIDDAREDALYLARGYRFVPLEEALADPIYGHADTYVRANGISWLHRWTSTEGKPIRWEPEPPAWIVAANKAPASELEAIAGAQTAP